MANMNAELMLPQYQDDFGNNYDSFTFKFEENVNFSSPDALTGIVTAPRPTGSASSPCGTASLFAPRKIKVVFSDASSVEIPVPALTDVENAITTARNAPNVACVQLIGERWSYVPPGRVGLTSGDFANTGLAGVVKPENNTYTFNYSLDGGGSSFGTKKSYEIEPVDIFNAQIGCLDGATLVTGNELNCAPSGGIDLRHYVGKRENTSTNGLFSRKVFVSASDTAQIRACAGAAAPSFQCLGYVGTDIANTDLFY